MNLVALNKESVVLLMTAEDLKHLQMACDLATADTPQTIPEHHIYSSLRLAFEVAALATGEEFEPSGVDLLRENEPTGKEGRP